MSKTNEKTEAPAGGTAAAPTEPEKLTTAQVAERYQEAATTLRAEGATAERTRIQAIDELSVAGAEEIIAAAKKDGSTPEATAVKVVQHQKAHPTPAPTAAAEPGKKHLANMAGDEATANAPKAQPAKGESELAETVASLTSLSTLRRPEAASPAAR